MSSPIFTRKVHPTPVASLFKAGSVSTAWSIFSVYCWGPARPVASLLTGTVGKVTAQALKPFAPTFMDIASAPIVNRVAPAVSNGMACLIVDTALNPVIKSGKENIDAYVKQAITEAEAQEKMLQSRTLVMVENSPKLIQEFRERSAKWSSTCNVQQMLKLADKLDAAEKQARIAFERSRDYQNDPALDSIKAEIGVLTAQLEQANKDLDAFESDIYKKSSWSAVLFTKIISPEDALKRTTLSTMSSSLKQKFEEAQKRLAATRAEVKDILTKQDKQAQDELNLAKDNLRNCRIDSVIQLEASKINPIKERLAKAQQELTGCLDRINASQTAAGRLTTRLTGFAPLVDSALINEKSAIEKQIESIKLELHQESRELIISIKAELQELHALDEALRQLTRKSPETVYSRQSKCFFEHSLVVRPKLAIDTPESLEAKQSDIVLRKDLLRTMPETCKQGYESFAKYNGEKAKKTLAGQLIAPIRSGLSKGICTSVCWVALKIVDAKIINYLKDHAVPMATSFILESNPSLSVSPLIADVSDACPNPCTIITNVTRCMGVIGISLVAYKAMGTYNAYKEDQKRTRDGLIEKAIQHGLREGLSSVFLNQSTVNYVSEIAGDEIYDYFKSQTHKHGIDQSIKKTEKFIDETIAIITRNRETINEIFGIDECPSSNEPKDTRQEIRKMLRRARFACDAARGVLVGVKAFCQ